MIRTLLIICLIVLCVVWLNDCFVSYVQTRALPLDPTFGKDGFVVTNLGGSASLDLLIQPDGKLIAIGLKSRNDYENDLALVRYQSDGSADLTFGSEGIVLIQIEDSIQMPAAVLQPDGKIVIVGSIKRDQTIWNIALIRFNTDGTIDSTFGRAGKVITYLEGRESAQSITLQRDGKIIVLGRIGRKDGYLPATSVLLRYLSDGTLDSTFGDGGKVMNTLRWDTIPQMRVVQADDKILVMGTMLDSGNLHDFGLLRHNADGTFDITFGHDGLAITDLGAMDDAKAIAIQSDGKILVGGHCWGGKFQYGNISLTRYNWDGTLDSTFGKQGVAIYDTGFPSEPYDISLQTDGRFVIMGVGYFQQQPDMRLLSLRFNSDGSRDVSFGQGGTTITPPQGDFMPRAMVIQADGKIVVAGNTESLLISTPGKLIPTRYGPFDFTLVRYLP